MNDPYSTPRRRIDTAAELICALPVLATWGRSGVRYWLVTRDVRSKWEEWKPC